MSSPVPVAEAFASLPLAATATLISAPCTQHLQQQAEQVVASSSAQAPMFAATALSPSVRVGLGALDSYMIPEYLSSSQADDVMCAVDGFVEYLARDDPRMLFKIYGRSLEYPRDKAFYGSVTVKNGERVEPFYKYAKDTPPVKNWAGSVLEQVAAGLQRSCGQPCNHVVVNQYQSGADYIGAHHDKPATFHPGSSVLTLSLGGERTLRLTCVKGPDVGQTHDLRLAHGSLFVLGPETNTCWKHAILKDKKAEHRRVSLTFRQIDAVRKTQIDVMDLTQHE